MRLIPFKRENDQDLDRVFNAFLGAPAFASGFGVASVAAYSPRLDLKETDEAVTVQADLPGLDKKDIQVTLEEGLLSISGTRKAEHEEHDEKKAWHRVERSWGSFERHLRLGDTADPAKVKAEYKDGVLTVTVGKKAETRPKPIEVQ